MTSKYYVKMSSTYCAKKVELRASDFFNDDIIKKISDAKIVIIQDAFENLDQIKSFLTKKESIYLKNVIIIDFNVAECSIHEYESFDIRLNAPQIINITENKEPKNDCSCIFYRKQSTSEFILLEKCSSFSYALGDNLFESFINYLFIGTASRNLLNIPVNEQQFFFGKRMIDYAIEVSDILSIKFLKLFNVDLESTNEFGKRPLEIATERKNKKAFLALLDLNSFDNLTEIKDNKILKLLSLTQEGTGLNLLMIATSNKCNKIVKFLVLNQFVDINDEIMGISAVTIAKNNKSFEILHFLLQNNAKIPLGFNEYAEDIPKYIKRLIVNTTKVHEYIASNNKKGVEEIIQKYPNLRFFYNLNGQSAVATAISLNNIEIYELLISNGITLCRHEDIQTLIHTNIVKKVRDANRKYLKLPYEHHIVNLLKQSRIGHDVPDSLKQKYSHLIFNAIEQLSSVKEIDMLFQIVTTADFLNLIFEFNRSTVDQIDPVTDKSTMGITYLNGWIYIGTKGLKEESTKEEKNMAMGTIAHEICHFAVQLTYKNTAKPFIKGDSVKKQEFQVILDDYERYFRI